MQRQIYKLVLVSASSEASKAVGHLHMLQRPAMTVAAFGGNAF